MKEMYYSEVLDKYFESKRECLEMEAAEKRRLEAEEKKKAAKDIRAKEVEEAYKQYVELRDAFTKDYGGYRLSYSNVNGDKKIELTDINKMLEDWFA